MSRLNQDADCCKHQAGFIALCRAKQLLVFFFTSFHRLLLRRINSNLESVNNLLSVRIKLQCLINTIQGAS